MAPPGPSSSSHPDSSSGGSPRRESYGDPWQAFGYLVAGVLFYGFLGWLLDRWLETGLLVVAGIFVGAGLGVFMTFRRFGGRDPVAGDVRQHPMDRQTEHDRTEREE